MTKTISSWDIFTMDGPSKASESLAGLAPVQRLVALARFRGALMDDVAGAVERFVPRVPYPSVFQEFVERHVFVAFDVGEICIYSNIQGEEDDLARLFADKLLTRELVGAGFLPFGRPTTGDYDRICFDVRDVRDPQDAPVVRMDHEAILSKGRVPRPSRLADGLMNLVDLELQNARPNLHPPR